MVAKCDQVSGFLSKVKTLLPFWLTLREYNVIVGQNAGDQITQTSGGSRVGARKARVPPYFYTPRYLTVGMTAPPAPLSEGLDPPLLMQSNLHVRPPLVSDHFP